MIAKVEQNLSAPHPGVVCGSLWCSQPPRLCSISTTDVLQLWSLKPPKEGVRCARIDHLRSEERLKAGTSTGRLHQGCLGGFALCITVSSNTFGEKIGFS